MFTISGLSVFAMILPAGFRHRQGRKKVGHGSKYRNSRSGVSVYSVFRELFSIRDSCSIFGSIQRAFARLVGDLDLRCRAGERPRTSAGPTPYDRGDRRCRRAAARRDSRRSFRSRRAVLGLCAAARSLSSVLLAVVGRETLQGNRNYSADFSCANAVSSFFCASSQASSVYRSANRDPLLQPRLLAGEHARDFGRLRPTRLAGRTAPYSPLSTICGTVLRRAGAAHFSILKCPAASV